MNYTGYALTALNYFLYCGSRFQRKKRDILLMDILAKLATVFALYCLGSLTGSYNMFISLVLLITAAYRERHKEKFSRPVNVGLFLLSASAYLMVCVWTFHGVSSILVTTTSTLSLVSNWWLPPQKMRLMGCFVSVLYLVYMLTIQNWAGLLELFVFFSNVVSYIKYKKTGIGD